MNETLDRPLFTMLLLRAISLWGSVSVIALLLSANYYRFDIIANFAHCTTVMLALSTVYAVFGRRWRFVFILSLLVIAHLPTLSRYIDRVATTRPNGGNRLTIQSFNVFEINKNKEEVIDFLLQQKADVILLCEISSQWRDELARLAEAYPHVISLEREQLDNPALGNFGIALYSRYPLQGGVIFAPGSGIPFISARLAIGGSTLKVVGLHTFAPLNEGYWIADKKLVDRALLEIRAGELAVIGVDFNSTPTGSIFRRIIDNNLSPAGSGRALRQTLRIFGVYILQLDHIFLSPGFRVLRDEIGPSLGSDHRPILTEVTF